MPAPSGRRFSLMLYNIRGGFGNQPERLLKARPLRSISLREVLGKELKQPLDVSVAPQDKAPA